MSGMKVRLMEMSSSWRSRHELVIGDKAHSMHSHGGLDSHSKVTLPESFAICGRGGTSSFCACGEERSEEQQPLARVFGGRERKLIATDMLRIDTLLTNGVFVRNTKGGRRGRAVTVKQHSSME